MRIEKGFTLVELLVSVLILSFVILGASMLFTQAQWYHLGADKRSEIQDHARVIMETMERDMRMIGHGVPKGADVGGVTSYGAERWDAIFSATVNSIGFTGDVDNGGTILREDAASTAANQITVDNPTYYANVATTNENIVLVNNRSAWADLTVNAISGNILTMNANIPSASTFTSEKGEIFTLERVFYRLVGDTNNDGICNLPYPYCRIERAEIKTNNPTSVTETAANSDYQTLGDHVWSLNLVYQNATGTGSLDTSVASNLPAIAKINITLECRNRWLRVGDVQSVRMTSHVLVRNKAL